jgi:integration host factor subunit beta
VGYASDQKDELAELRTNANPSGTVDAACSARPSTRSRAVTRAELISELAATSPDLRVEDAELIVGTVFDQITAALARGERVELRGFGAFTVKQRSARIGRNPRTQETVQVDEEAVPHFKTGREILRRLNGGRRPASA